MNTNTTIMNAISIGSTVFIFLYFITMIAYALTYIENINKFAPDQSKMLRDFFQLGNGYLTFGVPFAGVAAFAVVSILNFVSGGSSTNNLSFKAFGLEFTGPAGPVTLWVVCFLALVAAIYMFGPSVDANAKKPTRKVSEE